MRRETLFRLGAVFICQLGLALGGSEFKPRSEGKNVLAPDFPITIDPITPPPLISEAPQPTVPPVNQPDNAISVPPVTPAPSTPDQVATPPPPQGGTEVVNPPSSNHASDGAANRGGGSTQEMWQRTSEQMRQAPAGNSNNNSNGPKDGNKDHSMAVPGSPADSASQRGAGANSDNAAGAGSANGISNTDPLTAPQGEANTGGNPNSGGNNSAGDSASSSPSSSGAGLITIMAVAGAGVGAVAVVAVAYSQIMRKRRRRTGYHDSTMAGDPSSTSLDDEEADIEFGFRGVSVEGKSEVSMAITDCTRETGLSAITDVSDVSWTDEVTSERATTTPVLDDGGEANASKE